MPNEHIKQIAIELKKIRKVLEGDAYYDEPPMMPIEPITDDEPMEKPGVAQQLNDMFKR